MNVNWFKVIVVIVFSVLWSAFPGTHAQAAGILQDNFNSYSDGSIMGQGGWQNYYNGDNWIVQGADTFEGTKALYSNTVADNVIYRAGTLLPDGEQAIYIKTKDRSGWHADSGFGFRLSEGYPGSTFISVDFIRNGSIRYYDQSGTKRSFAVHNDNEWTLLEIEWRSSDSTARYRVNKDAWTDWHPFANSGSFTGLDHAGLDFYLPSGSGGVYVDYISPDPYPSTPTPTPMPSPTIRERIEQIVEKIRKRFRLPVFPPMPFF